MLTTASYSSSPRYIGEQQPSEAHHDGDDLGESKVRWLDAFYQVTGPAYRFADVEAADLTHST